MNFLEFDDSIYDQLQLFVEQGRTDKMPEKLVEYLQVMELIRSLYDKYKSKKFIYNLLKLPPYNLSEYRINKVYTDALNFFYSDNTIKRQAWANIYADKFDKLALLCIEADDYQAAGKNFEIAAKLRMGEEKEQVIPSELRDRRPIFYTINPKEVNFPKVNRRELAQWIDQLPDITLEERARLHRDGMTPGSDGNILDVDFEEIPFIDVK